VPEIPEPRNHGDVWHPDGRCGYCDGRRTEALNAFFAEHPEQLPEIIVRPCGVGRGSPDVCRSHPSCTCGAMA
jgi:hypothetical protein